MVMELLGKFNLFYYWFSELCVKFLVVLHIVSRCVYNLSVKGYRLSLFFPLNFYSNRSAEFILYKLKEMGKINQEDISLVMEEFEDLDVDQSGTLSATDITLAQSAEVAK